MKQPYIFKYIFSVLFIFLFTDFGFAQSTADTLNFNSTLTFGGMRKAGVFSQTNISANLKTVINKSNWTFDNHVAYTYTNVNGGQLSDDWTVISKLRYSFPQQQIAPTFIHVYKNNLLYRIENSQRYILGLSITPLKKQQQFWFFIGGGYERTLYNGTIFENSPAVNNLRNFGIATFYLENEHHLIKNKLFLKYNLFYIQSTAEWQDYTIWFIPSLNIAINKNLVFAVSYDYRFRNVHLADIPGFNELLTFNVKVSIGN